MTALAENPITVCKSPQEGARTVARTVAACIRARQAAHTMAVIGLATGSTPIGLYAELVRMHREEGLSFDNVITFNLDEYYPIEKTAPASYNNFMHQHLFNHINIQKQNIHIPDGSVDIDLIASHCAAYEQAIVAAGGLDLQILGIGRNGHIGFNEPGSQESSITRIVKLEESTRIANVGDFGSLSDVPHSAITMGINTILKARKIILMAWGNKNEIIQQAIEGDTTAAIPATFLKKHSNCSYVLDETAARNLTTLNQESNLFKVTV